MLRTLFLALNVRPEEEKQVLLLLGMGFFMGIFLATYQITAETIFLDRLGHVLLREAMFTSGVLGVITTALFAFFQNRLPFAALAIQNLLFIFLFTTGLYYALNYADEAFINYVAFVMFVMTTPVSAVLLLGFWGVFGRMFDLRQSKRIINRIDTGQLSAAILAFLAVPLLSRFIPNTDGFLVISAISILCSLFFLFRITRIYNLEAFTQKKDKKEKKETRLSQLLRNNYVLLLSAFLGISMISFTFMDYSFKEVIQDQYPDQNSLRNFLGIFNGSILILSFLLQTFVNDRIVADYGLKVPLLILPIVLGVFTLAAIFSEQFLGYTNDGSLAGFSWFFLFISLGKLFNASLREAMENPAFKLYFMPLDAKIRFDIQAKVEGVINELARLFAGVLILVLPVLAFFELIHYSYALILFLIVYLVIIGKLYAQYRQKIHQKLESKKEGDKKFALGRDSLIKNLKESLMESESQTAIFSYRLLEKIRPNAVIDAVNTLMNHDTSEVRDYAQVKMNAIKGLSVSDKYIIYNSKTKHLDVTKKVISGKDLDSLLDTGDIPKKRISKLCKSENKDDRQYAAELITNFSSAASTSYLIELLNDISPNVRLAAIKASEKRNNVEIIHALVNNLNVPLYSNPAADTLVTIGERCLSVLDSAFYRSGQSIDTMLKIIQIFGRVGGERSINMLWNKVDFPDKVLVAQILPALALCGFKADESQASRIKYTIESDIADIAWNMAAYNEVLPEGFGIEVKNAILEKNQEDIEHLYMLLSMIYDPRSIQLVKENIDSGLGENITYAVELLDVFLSDDLKQKIIPLLDDLSEAEKARRLEVFFPRQKLESEEVLKSLINRDFNQANRWTKTCALYQVGLLELKSFENDLVANLFNPDQLVRETAAWSLCQINPDIYDFHISRVKGSVKRALDRAILKEGDKEKLMIHKVLFLKNMPMFSSVSGATLANLVDQLKELHLVEGESLSIDDTYNSSFYIVYKGEINLYEKGSSVKQLQSQSFIGEMVGIYDYARTNFLIAVSDTILLQISKDRFYGLLADNVAFAKNFINYI